MAIYRYRTRKGDTFTSIAKKYKLPTNVLMNANQGIFSLSRGLTLRIPTGGGLYGGLYGKREPPLMEPPVLPPKPPVMPYPAGYYPTPAPAPAGYPLYPLTAPAPAGMGAGAVAQQPLVNEYGYPLYPSAAPYSFRTPAPAGMSAGAREDYYGKFLAATAPGAPGAAGAGPLIDYAPAPSLSVEEEGDKIFSDWILTGKKPNWIPIQAAIAREWDYWHAQSEGYLPYYDQNGNILGFAVPGFTLPPIAEIGAPRPMQQMAGGQRGFFTLKEFNKGYRPNMIATAWSALYKMTDEQMRREGYEREGNRWIKRRQAYREMDKKLGQARGGGRGRAAPGGNAIAIAQNWQTATG